MPGAAVPDPDLLASLRATFRDAAYSPPLLPSSAFRLLQLSRNQETKFRDLLLILQSDPFIAGQVLRVASSPVFMRGEPVRSLEQALSRLGITVLSQIFLQITVTSRVFRAPGYSGPMEMLRVHSVMAAHAARLLCRNTTRVIDETAFMCGLLHDVGAAVSVIALGDMHPRHQPSFSPSVQSAINDVRDEACQAACLAWDLPSDLQEVIVKHHEPFANGRANALGCVVLLADYLATEAGFGGLPETFCGVELAQTSLGISDPAMRLMVAELRTLSHHVF